jgi:hypothetical protein
MEKILQSVAEDNGQHKEYAANKEGKLFQLQYDAIALWCLFPVSHQVDSKRA